MEEKNKTITPELDKPQPMRKPTTEEKLDRLMGDFDSHAHCMKCHKWMLICEENRDGVCERCKETQKKKEDEEGPVF